MRRKVYCDSISLTKPLAIFPEWSVVAPTQGFEQNDDWTARYIAFCGFGLL